MAQPNTTASNTEPEQENSRFYQSADEDIIVEVFTLDRTPHTILWRRSIGFAGWFKPTTLDKHAPFTRINRPEWAFHTPSGVHTKTATTSPELEQAETDHARALLILRAYEEKVAGLQVALSAARQEVVDSRQRIRAIQSQ